MLCHAIPRGTVSLRRLRSLAVFSVLTLVSGASQAWAAAVDVPASVSPGQVEKRLAPAPKPSERLQLSIPSPVESQDIPAKLREQLESKKFSLKNVTIEGATVYSPAELSAAYNEFVGKTVSLLDARTIASRITALYRNNGYILSQAVVPTQEINNGILKIRVVEGFIGNVTFTGDKSTDGELKRLNSVADNIKGMRPTKMEELERYMLLMNDLPGSGVTGLIRPSSSEFGAADLVLTVTHKEFEGSYTFDNRGSKYLGPWQHTAILGANSLINSYDHTQVRVMTTTPARELFLAELQHDEYLNDEGTKLSFSANYTRTRPGDDLKFYRIVGTSSLFEAKVSHPFIRLRQQSLVARAVFDVRNSNTDIFKDQFLTEDRMRIGRVGVTYGFLDTMMGSNSIDVQLSQGMNIFDATDKKGIDRSNPVGDSGFTKANFDMSRLQPIGHGFSVLTSATGQFSFQPLLTDEQFSLGGADFGRAYDPSEGLGDSGLAGKIEARYDAMVEKPYFDSYQLFTFFDIGETWARGAASAEESSTSMGSIGFGTRLKFTDNFSSAVEADFPVLKPHNDPTNYRHNPRIFFSLTAKF